jgi:hypothetical protein
VQVVATAAKGKTMKPVIIFSLGLGEGCAERRFYRFTEKEASQKGATILDPIRIIVPEGSRLLTDDIGRLVRLRWTTAGPNEQTSDVDANRAYQLAEQGAQGFRVLT